MFAPEVNSCANPDVSDECFVFVLERGFCEQDVARRYRYANNRRALRCNVYGKSCCEKRLATPVAVQDGVGRVDCRLMPDT